jgi:putative toxin-antitoxin system antitoxin component (TIGR02293 family)
MKTSEGIAPLLEGKDLIEQCFPELENVLSSPLNLIAYARSGVSMDYVERFLEISGMRLEKLAPILGLSSKTLRTYERSQQPLPPAQGEHLLQLLLLFKEGIEVIGSQQGLSRWLEKPNYALGGVVGEALLSSSLGIEEIRGVLTGIAYGDFS